MTNVTNLSETLKSRIKLVPIKARGGGHEWQDRAVRVAQELGLDYKKLPKTWFKAFKTNSPALLERTYRYVADYPNASNRMGLFFWALGKFKREGCIPNTFTS